MIFIITFLALLLRLPLLNESLWLDEAIEALALRGYFGSLLTYALGDFQPPLYHFILNVWTRIFGTSEVALRAISLFAGVGVVVVGARLAAKLDGVKAATITGLLLATNPLLIYYSAEGRTYMLTTFLILAAMTSLWYNKLVAYSLFAMLAIWTSYLSWFWAAALLVYLLLTKNYRYLFATALACLTLIFWLPSLLASLDIGTSTIETSSGWGQVVGGISTKAVFLTWVKFNLGRISFDNKMIYAGIVMGLALIHVIAIKVSATRIQKLPSLLFVWLLAPVTLATIFAFFLPIYQYFRLLFVLPAYLVGMGILVSYRKSSILPTILIGSQIIFLVIYYFSPRFHREDWRSVVYDYGVGATYAIPSLNQSAPLLYYGVASSQIKEPKTQIDSTATKIVYLKYAEDLFDQHAKGQQNLRGAGYTQIQEVSYPGLAIMLYQKE